MKQKLSRKVKRSWRKQTEAEEIGETEDSGEASGSGEDYEEQETSAEASDEYVIQTEGIYD